MLIPGTHMLALSEQRAGVVMGPAGVTQSQPPGNGGCSHPAACSPAAKSALVSGTSRRGERSCRFRTGTGDRRAEGAPLARNTDDGEFRTMRTIPAVAPLGRRPGSLPSCYSSLQQLVSDAGCSARRLLGLVVGLPDLLRDTAALADLIAVLQGPRAN